MSILIKNVKVQMSRLGLHSDKLPKPKVMYVPSVTVTYEDSGKKARSTYINELFGRFKKSDYIGKVICGEFFVLIFKTEWDIISPECRLMATMPLCGEIIGADEDNFIVRTGNIITGYNIEGHSIGSRELTAEEIQSLDKK